MDEVARPQQDYPRLSHLLSESGEPKESALQFLQSIDPRSPGLHTPAASKSFEVAIFES